MRIVFAGTPAFAVPSLKALVSKHQVIAVYTQPDRPAGRGLKLTPSPVKQVALSLRIPVFQPEKLRSEQEWEAFSRLKPDLLVVVAYGLIVPKAFLDIPSLGAVNVHASLLPRWRGAAPIQRAILAGDRESGVTVMQMVEQLDAGPILLQKAVSILPNETAGELADRLAQLGAEALLEALEAYAAGTLEPKAQEEAQASYAAKISKEEAKIDWSQPAWQIARKVRAFNPWPIAYAYFGDRLLKVWRAEALGCEAEEAPGTIVKAKRTLEVATGSSLLRLLEVQLAGGRVLAAEDFLNAYPCRGVRLG
jgi:methionyl-tRNA formyltransferase